MKKLLGISLVAAMTVSPMIASAENVDLISTPIIPSPAIATISYVKGAYNVLGNAVNSKQDQLKAGNADVDSSVVLSTGIAESVEAAAETKLMSEKAIMTAIEAAQSSASYDDTELAGKVETLEGTVGNASSGLVQAVNTLNGDASTPGSVAKAEADAKAYAADGSHLTAGTVAKTALASGVQTSLDKADGAVQSASLANKTLDIDAKTLKVGGASVLTATDIEGKADASSVYTKTEADAAFDAKGAAAAAEAAAKAYVDEKYITVYTTWGATEAQNTEQVYLSPAPEEEGEEQTEP